nr:MAG TPA: hypothetical protein [Caudoviricetes sp.]
MTYGEMSNYITHISDNDLVALCKSVYEFKNGNGVLEPTSTLKILAENLQFSDVRVLEYIIIEEAHKRYERIVLLLIKDAPSHYLK